MLIMLLHVEKYNREDGVHPSLLLSLLDFAGLQIYPAPEIGLHETQSSDVLIPAVHIDSEVVEDNSEIRVSSPNDGHLSGRKAFLEVNTLAYMQIKM